MSLEKIFKRFDKNNEGTTSLDEFSNAFLKKIPGFS